MNVFVTGASGFVGGWLVKELESAGAVVRGIDDQTDVTDADAIASLIARVAPDAVVHLAAIALGSAATADPALALRVNVAGTINVLEAVRRLRVAPVVLVTGSSEAYGRPEPDELPLRETSPLRPTSPYGISKAAQESVAISYSIRYALPVVVTRSFNHTGPGQNPAYVLPAIAARVRSFAAGEAATVPVGNVDVRRDFSDVRDVVRAYRLLIERAATGRIAPDAQVVNVCSGESRSIAEAVAILGGIAGVEPVVQIDPSLIRASDAPDIRGDAYLLRELTGWSPAFAFESTLRDLYEHTAAPTTPGVGAATDR